MFQPFMDIRREELPLALLMFGYFFLVITTFWILKPLKKGLFIEFYDEQGFALSLTASRPFAGHHVKEQERVGLSLGFFL